MHPGGNSEGSASGVTVTPVAESDCIPQSWLQPGPALPVEGSPVTHSNARVLIISFLSFSSLLRFYLYLSHEEGAKMNDSEVTDFILLGFRAPPELQLLLFLMFLMVYVVIVLGNVSMIIVVRGDTKLHTPMYFFLSNLSYLDLCYSTVIAPKTLANFLTKEKKISYNGCAAQFFFFALFVTTEGFLLAVMAFDRFSAICSPLLYPVHMSQKVCVRLVTGSYLCGCINSVVQTGFTFSLRFCGENRLDHFFCDVPALIKIACVDPFVNEIVLFVLSALIIISTTAIILVSYAYILCTVLKIPSTRGRSKTFSTCGSHVAVVSLFYGTVFFMYAQPGAISAPEQSKIVAVFYTLIIPMLNPLIYSLRNKDVKDAVKRMVCRGAGV
ncbi:olfactory receptor 9S13-like [Oryctolagus cuniculus]